MAIKVGFSSSLCPELTFEQLAAKADELGFYGVEIAPTPGREHLHQYAELATPEKVAAVRATFDDRQVEITGITCSATLEHRDHGEIEQSMKIIRAHFGLAEALGARYVRIPAGKPVGSETANSTLSRTIDRTIPLAEDAIRHGVSLLIGNTPNLPSSRELWILGDGTSHPSMRCMWNPVFGLAVGEKNALAIPRLGKLLKQVQVVDAAFDASGKFEGYRLPGEGSVDFQLMVTWLKGIAFDGYLMVDWPRPLIEQTSDVFAAAKTSLDMLLAHIQHTDPELTAYKKDKNPANWGPSAPKSYVERKPVAAASDTAEAES